MKPRVVLMAPLFTLLLLGLAAGQTQEIPVNDVKMFAGQWVGRAFIQATILPTELSIKEDGSYTGHVGNRQVGGVIRIVAGEPRYEGHALRGRLSLYQGNDRRLLRARADSGETMDYEESK